MSGRMAILTVWAIGLPIMMFASYIQWANDKGHIELGRGNGYAVAVRILLSMIIVTVEIARNTT